MAGPAQPWARCGALENFGGKPGGKPFDRRVLLRLLGVSQAPLAAACCWRSSLTLIASGLSLLAPYLIKVAIDSDIAAGNVAGLWRTAGLLLLTFIALFFATWLQQYLLSWVGQRVLATLRDQLFRHLQALHLGYHDTHIVGVTISRVISDVSVINDLLSQGLVTLVGDVIVLVGIVAIMLSMSPRACASGLRGPAADGCWRRGSSPGRAQAAFRETRARVAAVIGGLAEDITGMRVIQAFAQEDASEERFDEVNAASRDANIGAMNLSFVFLPSVEFISMIATAIVLWFGGLAVDGRELTLGVVVAFLAYVTRFFQPIQELSQLYTTMQAAMAGGERVLELLDIAPAVHDPPDARAMPPIRGAIELRRRRRSPTARASQCCTDVNLTIEPGQTVALVGPTARARPRIANLVAASTT